VKTTYSGKLAVPAGTTGAITGPDLQNNFGERGIQVVVDITVNAGGLGATTVTIEGKDRASGKYYPLLASAALSAVATTVLRVFPQAVAVANLVANDCLPDIYRIRTTGNGNPMTYTVGWSTAE
jgi:hypothetical protein